MCSMCYIKTVTDNKVVSCFMNLYVFDIKEAKLEHIMKVPSPSVKGISGCVCMLAVSRLR